MVTSILVLALVAALAAAASAQGRRSHLKPLRVPARHRPAPGPRGH